jgi:hypothetical protein
LGYGALLARHVLILEKSAREGGAAWGAMMQRRTQLNSLSDCAALVACALMLAAGCGDDDGGDKPIDMRDRPDNGVIAIDELALTGEISDGELTLQIPLHSLDKGDAAGELEIRLIGVEDGDSVRNTRVAYEVDEGDSRTVRAKLKVPSSLEDEPLERARAAHAAGADSGASGTGADDADAAAPLTDDAAGAAAIHADLERADPAPIQGGGN